MDKVVRKVYLANTVKLAPTEQCS